jgi:cytochrome c553
MKKEILITLVLILCIVFLAANVPASGAPGVRVLDSIKDTYSSVRFDHPKHEAIAGSCATCHHEHNIAKGLPCKQCHSLTPAAFKNSVNNTFMACANCHGAYDPDNPRIPGLKTAYHRVCFSCHRGMAGIGTDPRGCTELCHSKKSDKIGMMRIKK